MITIGLCTAREEPGFADFADSLVHNLNRWGVPAELIVVDKLLWAQGNERRRRQQLADAVRGRFAYRHVPPKPSPWQGPWRKTQSDHFDLNNARNTVLALTRSSYVVFTDDCIVVDEAWLTFHALAARQGHALAGSFTSYATSKVIDGRVVEGEPHPGKDHRGETPMLVPGGWLWGLNMGFPLSVALQVNGFDEMYSGEGGSDDCDFGVRIQRAGCKIVLDPRCVVYQLLGHHTAVCGYHGHGKPARPPKERRLRDGKNHYSNEFLIQELADDAQRTVARGNDFNLRELRAKALATGTFPTDRKLTHDWRDGEALAAME